MIFGFNVLLNDEDYLKFNKFWMTRSPYGKKEIVKLRLMFAFILLLSCVIGLLYGGLSLSSAVWVAANLIALVLIQVFFEHIMVRTVKQQMRSLKKKGKPGYTPCSELQFFDECVVELTPDVKTEQRYSVIERVSVVRGEAVYIHVNSMAAFILPLRCFEGDEHLNDFLNFIGSKGIRVDVY